MFTRMTHADESCEKHACFSYFQFTKCKNQTYQQFTIYTILIIGTQVFTINCNGMHSSVLGKTILRCNGHATHNSTKHPRMRKYFEKEAEKSSMSKL